jgi:hypothetical protein
MYSDETYTGYSRQAHKGEFDRRYLERNKYHKLLAIPHYTGIALTSNIRTLWRFDTLIDMKRGSYQCNEQEAECVEDVEESTKLHTGILRSVETAIREEIIPTKALIGRFVKCHKQKC